MGIRFGNCSQKRQLKVLKLLNRESRELFRECRGCREGVAADAARSIYGDCAQAARVGQTDKIIRESLYQTNQVGMFRAPRAVLSPAGTYKANDEKWLKYIDSVSIPVHVYLRSHADECARAFVPSASLRSAAPLSRGAFPHSNGVNWV